MEGETNTPAVEAGTDNAQPSTREYVPDPDFDGPSATETPEQEPEESTLNGETDESDNAQESDTPEQEAADEPKSEDDGVLEVPLTAKVKLPDGKTMTVDELRKGYLRQDDYTRKTQENATKYNARFSEVDALSTRIENTINVIADFLQKSVPAAPDQALAFTDPQKHYQQLIAHQSAMEQVNRLIELGAAPKEVKSQLDEAKHQQKIAEETAKLHAAMPKLADNAEKQKFFERALGVGTKIGFSKEEVQSMTDHRFFMLADLAIEGMNAREARKTAKAKVANVPPVAPQRRSAGVDTNPNRDALAAARKRGGMSMAEAARLVGDFD